MTIIIIIIIKNLAIENPQTFFYYFPYDIRVIIISSKVGVNEWVGIKRIHLGPIRVHST